ncbi:MAG: alanine--tRNA ligase [Bacteroidetes bacterium HGW-Bacteroidetes-4]|jgi:alanyl-tRNA synthetase|nr:MAG: alanine--tRNA ligase [Bacteroidetes bacterium HGW-Bacteroidetes-4]
MNSREIRQKFKDFFASKQHQVVASAPMVIKDDPTLMFTNAGMNQFKDIFLGNSPVKYPRIANAQKCLRVSGKHNDLEEVGHDTYHHTMFEMLGNWSFGDYFKEEAINWAWELLVAEFGLSPDRLYATIFEGDAEDNVLLDEEAKKHWSKFLPQDRILTGNKKDNFWEMGNTGPCGPCSEIHVDLRSDEERAKVDGKTLVNNDHPQVIEIWNLVFIQYNRKADGKLESLPSKHVDTGMGFERLCMALQGKQSNYDTDVFQPLIQEIADLSGVKYGAQKQSDVAMRVIADHIRTIAFAITDGQLPSNNKAGYVIRRILRRAVRYGFTFLDRKEPFMYRLIPVLIDTMGEAYPELKAQQNIIGKVIQEEENSFLRTLATGIKLLDQLIEKTIADDYKVVSGKVAFELYDTYGFPLDLTQLILKENGLIVNRKEFDEAMNEQKERSRSAATLETDDWVEVAMDDKAEFIGYDYTEADVHITKYRKVSAKTGDLYQLVFNITPFYAEGGGQVGDTGYIEADGKKYSIIDVKKEHNQIIHLVKELPEDTGFAFKAVVSGNKRLATQCNHSATHLLHQALRQVLGKHVEQKGSLVTPEYLRFDFSHFQKLTPEELAEVEKRVNQKIRENLSLEEKREIPIEKAREMGAMALFGEKYGDVVRVIKFGDSVELCAGTHVNATGQIGLFKITSESSIAAGIRRIEAVSAYEAEKYVNSRLNTLQGITELVKSNKNLLADIEKLIADNQHLAKKVDQFSKDAAKIVKAALKDSVKEINGFNTIFAKVEVVSAADLKDIAFQLKGELDNLFLVLGAEVDGKANLAVMISDNLVNQRNLNAGNIIREISKEIQGGGGGQAFFATAGGKNPEGIDAAIEKAKTFIK